MRCSRTIKQKLSTGGSLITVGLLLTAGFSQQALAQPCTITSSSSSLQVAKQKFAQSCPAQKRRDCDRFQGGWQCSTENLPLANSTASKPSTPVSNPSPSQPGNGGNAVLTIQAENATSTSGSGWVTERALNGFTGSGYIVWRGANDFRATDSQPPVGIKTYEFTVTQPGTYQFTARVQARVGNGSAAGDKDNDAWVKFTSGALTPGVRGDATKWTKFFVSGNDESWKNYSRGEQYSPKFFTDIQRNLSAGKHRILVGGRSTRFAIDTVGLRLIKATGAPVSQPQPTVPSKPAPSNPSPTPAPTTPSNGACYGIANALPAARANYTRNCPNLPRKDCDKVAGNWFCSSQNINKNTKLPTINSLTAPTAPATPTTPVLPVSSGNCTANGSSLQQARSNYAANCPSIPRKDCDPIGGGNWTCSSEQIRSNSAPVAKPTTPTQPSANVGRFTSNDLLVLHYDNCPDRDDGHAVVAGKAVLDSVGINNFMVVNGTCGAAIRSKYQKTSPTVLRAVWGNNWLDGFDQETASVNASADRWAATLANGDDVWVAEGGPSDFTAKVLRRIGQLYPSVNRKRIHVIQHSSGRNFNEANTSREGIQLVKSVADYRAIPNGNISNNGSADFNQTSSFFVNRARGSSLSSAWNVAFNYLNPNQRLDFSDTVELLYIINDKSTLTVDDFANRYVK